MPSISEEGKRKVRAETRRVLAEAARRRKKYGPSLGSGSAGRAQSALGSRQRALADALREEGAM